MHCTWTCAGARTTAECAGMSTATRATRSRTDVSQLEVVVVKLKLPRTCRSCPLQPLQRLDSRYLWRRSVLFLRSPHPLADTRFRTTAQLEQAAEVILVRGRLQKMGSSFCLSCARRTKISEKQDLRQSHLRALSCISLYGFHQIS